MRPVIGQPYCNNNFKSPPPSALIWIIGASWSNNVFTEIAINPEIKASFKKGILRLVIPSPTFQISYDLPGFAGTEQIVLPAAFAYRLSLMLREYHGTSVMRPEILLPV